MTPEEKRRWRVNNIGTRMSLDAFYSDPERKFSGEMDYGVWWHNGNPERFPRYRVSHVQDTGEMYAFSHKTQEVEIVAWFDTYEDAEKACEGWAELDNADMTLDWFREKGRVQVGG